ncbi:ICAM1 protein, partial [Chauna torquata]|nr:ICAM1 protein [Chauna torquata]
MDPAASCCALALLCLLLPGARPEPCRVAIVPEEPVVELGSSIVLNCSSSCGNYSWLSWEVSMVAQGPGWVSLSIPNVTEWSLELQCFGVFGARRDIAVTTLHAYRLSPPRLYLQDELVAGQPGRVSCNVTGQVAPPGPPALTVTLRLWGHPPRTGVPPVGFSFTAQLGQHGREVTCEATLRVGHRTVSAIAATMLWIWAAPYDVRVSASRATFGAGDNVTVTCHAEGNPHPRLHWELPPGASSEVSPHGDTVTIRDAQRVHGGTYRCLARNRYGASSASVDIPFQGSSRSVLIPVVVTLAVAMVVALVTAVGWLYHARGWKPIQE